MGSSVLFTRYTNCIEDIHENAEGAWTTAKGFVQTNGSSTKVYTNFGFHETGDIKANTIVWSNGAVWTAPVNTDFQTDDGDRLFLKNVDNEYWNITSKMKGTTDQITIICESVFYEGNHGHIEGDFIVWDDGSIWWPTDVDSDDYDVEASPAPLYDESYYTYDKGDWLWWRKS